MSVKARWILVFIAIGFIISTYLTINAHNPSSVVCKLGGHCQIVLSSPYAFLFGFPVSGWGMVWYGLGFILVYLTFSQRRYPWPYFLIWSVAGLVFSLYLLSLEAFKIHNYCTWCVSSLVAVTVIFVLTLWSRQDLSSNEQ